MESTKPTVFTGSNLEGVERVVKEKGKLFRPCYIKYLKILYSQLQIIQSIIYC